MVRRHGPNLISSRPSLRRRRSMDRTAPARRSVAAVVAAVAAAVIFLCHVFGLLLFALLSMRRGSRAVAECETVRRSWCRRGCAPRRYAGIRPKPGGHSSYCVLGGGAALIGAWRGFQKLWTVFTPFMTTSVNLTILYDIELYDIEPAS